MTETFPPALADFVRLICMQYVRANCPSRAEHEELRAFVLATSRLAPDDAHRLGLLLRALAALVPERWLTAAELMLLAAHAPGEAGDALRAALAPFAGHRRPARAVGAWLKRCNGIAVEGLHLRRLDPPHRRESALFGVAGSTR